MDDPLLMADEAERILTIAAAQSDQDRRTVAYIRRRMAENDRETVRQALTRQASAMESIASEIPRAIARGQRAQTTAMVIAMVLLTGVVGVRTVLTSDEVRVNAPE